MRTRSQALVLCSLLLGFGALGGCDDADSEAVQPPIPDEGVGEMEGELLDALGEGTGGQAPRPDARASTGGSVADPDARPATSDARAVAPDGDPVADDATPLEKDAAAPSDASPPQPDVEAIDDDARVPQPDGALEPDARVQRPDMRPVDDRECDIDRECENDELCDDGFCVEGCRENECGPLEVCRAGNCEIPVCDLDADCPEESYCAGGLCMPGCRRAPDNCPAGQRCGVINICELFNECLAAEICGNGFDDNCDQRVDEEDVCGLPCLPGRDCETGLLGECGLGQTTCVGDRLDVVQCEVRITPLDDVCNTLDDDCDGATDEAYPELSRPCTAGSGFCASLGQWICAADGGVRCDAVRGLGRTEECDGLDDDCDGLVDENFPDLGGPCTGGRGACARAGVRACNAAGDRTICDAQPGAPGTEVCDNADNDCNGRIDDALPAEPCYDGPEGTLGVGLCAVGGRRCVAGGLASCDGAIRPVAEACNGLDDDCDGAVDEADGGGTMSRSCFTGAAGLAGVGLCRTGSQTCALGRFGVCAGEVLPVAESCDAQDNDCDGQIDDGAGACGCQPGATRACYGGPAGTAGVGLCRNGTQTCGANATFGPCQGQRLPGAEECDGLDNDCDGQLDDQVTGVGVACNAGRGACQRAGQTVCNAQAGGVICNAQAGAAVAEACDALDNDCDGRTDEGFQVGAACASGSGSCERRGVLLCRNGAAACSAVGVQPAAETCDGLDNDCDGRADNGFNVGAVCQSGAGACLGQGRIACEAGVAVCGARPAPPQPEVCDHFDNDCDGEEDEGFPLGAACQVGVGACQRNGVIECAGDGGTQCSAAAGNGRAEQCNGQDDDCDGRADEGDPGGGAGCDSGQPGVCAVAHAHCRAGRVVCEADVRPSAEVCDLLDNDCDASTDEGLGQTTCGLGPCRHAVDNCVQGRVQLCQPMEGAVAERCDGQDNDCNGQTDDGAVDAGGACFAGEGICRRESARVCRNGALNCPAVPGNPGVEVCNELDDNCDGLADEGRTCPDDTPPQVEVTLDNEVVRAGQTVIVTVAALDEHGVSTVSLTANGANLPLDASRQARYIAAAPGAVLFVGTAADAWGNTGTGEATLRIADPNDNERPFVRITAPGDQETLTGLVQIRGTLQDPGFLDWQLEFSPDGVTWTPLAAGDQPAEDEALATIDPTLMLPGYVFVRLTGADVGGLSAFHQVAWRIPDGLSVGESKLGFRDLEIPLKGFKIAVDRVYDSRDRRMGDFGYGWRLKGQDVGLFEDIYGNVAVELPDGRREIFAINYDINPIIRFGTLYYLPPAGVSSKLEAMDSCVVVVSGGVVYCFLTVGRPPDIVNNYRLTTSEGVVYEILQGFGVRQVRDREGNTLTFTDDGVQSSTGVGVTYARDGLGRITSVTDPEGGVIRYAYDGFGHLVSVTDATNAVTRYTYDASHRLQDVILANNTRALRTEFDAEGRKVRQIDALGRATVYDHDLVNRTETVTNRLGHTSVYVYDAQGRITTITDPMGGVETTEYDAQGRLSRQTDANGGVSQFTYNAHNKLDTSMDAEGRVRRASYDALDRPLSLVDPLGYRIRATYDGNGRQDSTINASGGVERIGYDADGNRGTRTTAMNEVHRYTYDDGGNITRTTFPDGRTISYALDNNSRVIERQENDNPPVRFTYDAMGRMMAISLPDDSTISIERDPLGRAAAHTNAMGDTIRYAYHPTGPIATVTDALNQITRYTYDAEGRLVATEHADGSVSEIAWDAAGRATSRTLATGAEMSYGWDAGGRMTSVTQANGDTTRFEYDRTGKPGARVEPDGARWTQVRDAAGRVIQLDGPTGRATAAWDGDGRLLRETTPEGEVTYTWDLAGRRTGFNLGGQACTWSGPARANSTSTLTCQPGGAVRFEYDAQVHPVRVTYPNGVVTTYSWDVNGRIAGHETRDAQGALRVRRGYELDLAGRVSRAVHTDGGALDVVYDALGQVVSTRRSAPDGGVLRSRAYGYDEIGNRTRRTSSEGGVENSTHDLPGLAATDATFDYTYDLDGRLTGRVNRLSSVRESFSYDARNQLVAARRFAPNGARLGEATYVYDSIGRRVRRTVDGLVRRYLYDAEQLVAELDGAGAVVARWVHGPKLDQPLLMIRGNRTYSYVQDQRGDVVALLDASGQVVNRYEYDDFGEVLSSQELVENPLSFNGRERDPETGFVLLRLRMYDPRTGRFLQPDPHPGSLRFPLTQNPYIFGRNDPFSHTDPLGAAAALEYGFKLAEIFGMKAYANTPNAYELSGSLIGFMHGFAITNLCFIGNILEIANDGGDVIAGWGAAIEKTAAQMEEIKGLLGYFSHLDDTGFVGGYMNGAHFEVGFKFSAVLEPPEPLGDAMDLLGIENPYSWKKTYKIEKDYGGFGSGVTNGLEYLRLAGPQ